MTDALAAPGRPCEADAAQAVTAVDLLTQPQLVEQARAEFVKGTGGKPYRSPIPAGQKPPIP